MFSGSNATTTLAPRCRIRKWASIPLFDLTKAHRQNAANYRLRGQFSNEDKNIRELLILSGSGVLRKLRASIIKMFVYQALR